MNATPWLAAALLAAPLASQADPLTFTFQARGTASGTGDQFGRFGDGETAALTLRLDYDSADVQPGWLGSSVYAPSTLAVAGSAHGLALTSVGPALLWSQSVDYGTPFRGYRFWETWTYRAWFANGPLQLLDMELTFRWNDPAQAFFELGSRGMAVMDGGASTLFRLDQTQDGQVLGHLDFDAPSWTLANVGAVPEPRTWTLLLAGLAALGWRGQRARMKKAGAQAGL